MVTPRTSSNGRAAASAPARFADASLALPAPDKADFDASVAPLVISRILPASLSLFFT
jgi:hypothetical protein